MKKSTLPITLLAIMLTCGTASAQSFTYQSSQTKSTVVGGVGPTGTEAMGAYVEGKTNIVNADGTKTKSSFACVSMANPNNSKIFDTHMACDVTASDGTFSLVIGCQVISEDGSKTSCVGGMKGKTGAYKDRYGNFSQYSTDGEGNSKGSGQWFE